MCESVTKSRLLVIVKNRVHHLMKNSIFKKFIFQFIEKIFTSIQNIFLNIKIKMIG